MEARPKELLEYISEDGRSPFSEWLLGLRDIQARAIIRKRLNRVRQGNLGVSRPVGDGVFELKVDFGPGYRVYFANDGDAIVVLLCGGDKSSQEADIRKAQEYWAEYRRQ